MIRKEAGSIMKQKKVFFKNLIRELFWRDEISFGKMKKVLAKMKEFLARR